MIDFLPGAKWNPSDPEPGMYRNVPFEDYAKARAINNSLIKIYYDTESLAGVKLALEKPEIASAAKRFGTLFHSAALEPEKFKTKVQLGGPINPKTGKEYGRDTQKWADFESLHPDKIILAHEDADAFKAMFASVSKHPIAKRYLLKSPAVREVSACWNFHFETMSGEKVSVKLKGRPDAVLTEEPVLVDLKTTEQSLSPRALGKLFTDYGYYRAAAMYQDGYQALTGGEKPRFLFVVVQRKPPFECVVCELHEDFEGIGRAEYRNFCPAWVECEQHQRWLSAGEYWQGGQVHTDVLVVPPPRWKQASFSDGE